MKAIAALSARWTTTVAIAGLVLGSPPSSARAAGSWTAVAPIPTGIVRACGVWFPDNRKFYVLGGRTADTAGSDVLNPNEYDPVANSWATRSAAFPDAQVNNMVGGVLNFGGSNFIVVVGGSAAGATSATSDTRQYDPVTDALTTLASDPWPGNVGGTVLPGGAAVVNNKLYVFGGFDINTAMTNQIYIFDPAQAAGSRWTTSAATTPAQRGYVPVAASGGLIYGFGGALWDGAALQDTTDSWKYDPVADSISSTVAAIPRATGETRAVTQLDGKIWVLGGGRVAPNPAAQVDIYDPTGNSWSVGLPLLTARRNFPADINAHGEIFAVGGYNPTAPSAANEKFSDPEIFVDGFDLGDSSAWSVVVP